MKWRVTEDHNRSESLGCHNENNYVVLHEVYLWLTFIKQCVVHSSWLLLCFCFCPGNFSGVVIKKYARLVKLWLDHDQWFKITNSKYLVVCIKGADEYVTRVRSDWLLWCTMIWVILDLCSWSRSTQQKELAFHVLVIRACSLKQWMAYIWKQTMYMLVNNNKIVVHKVYMQSLMSVWEMCF